MSALSTVRCLAPNCICPPHADKLRQSCALRDSHERKHEQETVIGVVTSAPELTAVERLRNGGQPDLASLVECEIREAYSQGRNDERENLERIGVVADCPACGGRGERLMVVGSGPDIYQDLVDCPDCSGTGYARVRPA